MAAKSKGIGSVAWKPMPVKKRTSIGCSTRSRPTNKQKRALHKRYRGQGR